MIRFLPLILIIVVVLGGLGYWRLTQKPAEKTQKPQQPVEVPKTLPGASLESRVQDLEDTLIKLVPQVNNLKSPESQKDTSTLESKLSEIEAAVTELKVRVSALEKSSPSPVTSVAKYPLYIPLGSGGGPWADQAWNTLAEYQVAINPDNYSGYTSMQLEVNFRLSEAAGTGSVRLYNVTDGSSIASQLDTTSTTFSTQTSGTFKLPSGQKTYTIQVQSTQGKNLFVQSARIKVNF